MAQFTLCVTPASVMAGQDYLREFYPGFRIQGEKKCDLNHGINKKMIIHNKKIARERTTTASVVKAFNRAVMHGIIQIKIAFSYA